MNRVRFWGSTLVLPDDISDKEVVHCFTRGQCHSFARALHKLTGWQLAVLCHYPGAVNVQGDHVVCITPDNKLADITGVYEFGTKWLNLKTLVKVKPSTVQKLGWDQQDIRAAMPYARNFLERYQKDSPQTNQV